MIVTYITGRLFQKEEPLLSQEHSVGYVMENYYIFKKGGYEIIDGRIHVNIDKIVGIGQEMLDEAIRAQLDNDFEKGKEYVEKYFVWTDEMKAIAEKKKSLSSPISMATIDTELADMLLQN